MPVDPVLFEQVFVNLLDNAVKYTPAGAPLEISARAADRRAGDRGGGPRPRDRRRARRSGSSRSSSAARTPAAAASASGLPICRGIVEAHGGTIVAENREGGGAVFRIRLPLRETPPTVTAEPEEAAA